MRLQDGHPCQDDQFGVTNLSGKPGFIPDDDIGESNLSKQIVKCIGSVVCEYSAGEYMQINYEAPKIQAAVMHANMPLARFIIHCPPCISAITTAVHLCQANDDAITEWLVRVESVLIFHHVSSLQLSGLLCHNRISFRLTLFSEQSPSWMCLLRQYRQRSGASIHDC